ncbi:MULTISPECIES: phage tail protein [unclassified Moorena]|uniref:phage tail protein n=1 Tax=unclassified Moorena TaxID=2683338 RepID=UPI0013CA192E|nr:MULTISPECIES: phage tail protein [unclassified Moorena]NEP33584.1 phage tail protein [Moorena sp. SIO3B2]NES45978.1 phage tail protein [Moorena sp. SIO2C4]
MADTVEQIKNTYPIPVFYYRVTIAGDNSYAFSEVSGLSIEYETITYRDGLSYKEGAKYMPGLDTPINLTLQKGIVRQDSYLFDWFNTINLNTVEKRDLTIELLDESGEPVVSWEVINAFPKKLDAPSFNATSNEVAIESLELMANTLKVNNPPL